MEVEILVAEVGADAGRRPAVPHPLRRHGDGRGPLHRARRRGRGHRRPAGARPADADCDLDRGPAAPRPRPWPAPTARLAAADLEVAVLARTNGRRAFRRLDDDEVGGLDASPADVTGDNGEEAGGQPGPAPTRPSPYSAWPSAAISFCSSANRFRGTSPRAAFSRWTSRRICSTTSGLASVLTSPTSMSSRPTRSRGA